MTTIHPVRVASVDGPSLSVRSITGKAGVRVEVARPSLSFGGVRGRRIDRRAARRQAAGVAVAPDADGLIEVNADASPSCRGDKPHSTEVALEATLCALQAMASLIGAHAWSVGYRTFDLVPSLAQVRLDQRSVRLVDRALMAQMPWGSSLPGPSQALSNRALEGFDGPTVSVTISDLEVWPPQADGGLVELLSCPADRVLVLLLGGVVPGALKGTRVRCVPVLSTTDPADLASEIASTCAEASEDWRDDAGSDA